jgi:predicted dehydrogenase
LVAVIAEGRIGEPLIVEADFGFRRPLEPDHRLFDLALGGGALLDLGIYPLQLCSLVLGSPEHMVAEGVVGATGVDEVNAAVLRYAGERLGVVKSAIRVGMSCTARISGTEGWIDLPAFMHCPNSLTVTTSAGSEHMDGSYEGNGLRFEIEEVHRCLSEGVVESPIMPLDETLDLAATLDAIRAQLGVVYPGE